MGDVFVVGDVVAVSPFDGDDFGLCGEEIFDEGSGVIGGGDGEGSGGLGLAGLEAKVENQVGLVEIHFLFDGGGGEGFVVGFGNDGGLVVLVVLPEDDADFVIGEIVKVEDFDEVIGEARFPAVAVAGFDPGAVVVGHAVALVTKRLRFFFVLFAGIDEHDAAPVGGGLVVAENPDVGKDAGVVEELVGEHDDAIEPVIFENPAADLAFARTTIAVGEGGAVEDDGDAAGAFFGRLHFGEHGLEEKQGAVVGARHAGLVAGLFELPGFGFVAILAAPGDAKGGIGEHVIKLELGFGELVAGFAAVGVVGDEGVAEVDFGLPVVFDEQVGLADGVVGGGEFLSVDGDEFFDDGAVFGGGGAVEEVFFGHREHATGASGRVIERNVVGGKGDAEKFNHEADDFAGGEVFPGFFSALFGEAAEKFFVDVAHFERGEDFGAQVHFFILVEDGGEAVIFDHRADGGAIIEVLDDLVHVFGEAIDVGAEVLL